ncbi:MAG: outer rane efflux protein [Verrucomicrobia bacterium]|nr:outer rane efflux protein [Verrucomicrobiota bacterium]
MPFPAASASVRFNSRSKLLGSVALTCFLLLTPAFAEVLTLDRAIQLALEHNQRIRVSAYGPQIARANVLAEYGRFDPAIVFNRSYGEVETPGALLPLAKRPLTQTDDYSLSLDGLAPWGLSYSLGTTAENQRGTFNSFGDNYATFGGVTVTQPLLRGFGFGANLAGLRIAKANRGISDWQHKQTVMDTITNVIFAYNNLQQARDNLRIARLSRDLASQLFGENQKRNRVGSIADADVTQARARVATREESILVFERNVHDLENQLRLLIGEDKFAVDGAPLAIVELPPAAAMTVDAAADLRVAYELRPDYQSQRLGVKINRASQAFAQNQLLPRLDFVGSYGYGGLDPNFHTARTQVRTEDARVYSVGMQVRIPLTFSEGRGRARAARLTTKQSEADLVRLEEDIAVSVAAAAGQIATTQQRVAAAREALDLQQRVLSDEQKKFKAGSGDTRFVLQEQEQLAIVESSYVRALADQRRAHANYDSVIGRTLERYRVTLPK